MGQITRNLISGSRSGKSSLTHLREYNHSAVRTVNEQVSQVEDEVSHLGAKLLSQLLKFFCLTCVIVRWC